MPLYPPRNTAIRKKQIFEYRMYQLILAVNRNYSKEKLINLAEKARIAKLNLIKAKLHLIKSYTEVAYKNSDIKKIDDLDYEIMRWFSLDYKEIIRDAEEMFYTIY